MRCLCKCPLGAGTQSLLPTSLCSEPITWTSARSVRPGTDDSKERENGGQVIQPVAHSSRSLGFIHSMPRMTRPGFLVEGGCVGSECGSSSQLGSSRLHRCHCKFPGIGRGGAEPPCLPFNHLIFRGLCLLMAELGDCSGEQCYVGRILHTTEPKLVADSISQLSV